MSAAFSDHFLVEEEIVLTAFGFVSEGFNGTLGKYKMEGDSLQTPVTGESAFIIIIIYECKYNNEKMCMCKSTWQ